MKVKKTKSVAFGKKLSYFFSFFVVFVLPLFCYPNYSEITKWKFKFFLAISASFLLVLVLGFSELALIGKDSDFSLIRDTKNSASLAFLLYLAASLISFLFSSHRSLSLFGGGKYDGLISVALYFLIFIIASAFIRFDFHHELALALVVVLNCIISLLQFYGANPFYLYPKGMGYHDAFKLYSGEFLGTFGNVDVISAFFGMIIPLFYLLSIKSNGRKRLIYSLVLFPASLNLILSGVIAGTLGSIVGIFVAALLIKDNGEFKKLIISSEIFLFGCAIGFLLRKNYLIFFAVIAIMLIGIMLLRLNGFNRKKYFIFLFVLSSIASAAILTIILSSGNSDSGRLRIWRDAIRIFSDSPLVGHGPGSYLECSGFVFERFSEELGYTLKTQIDCAHNIYLNILACGGIISFVPFIAFVLSILKRAKNTPYLPSIIAYLVIGFFSFEISSVSALFYLLCGIAANYNKKQNKDV